jgi:hypothetical protein
VSASYLDTIDDRTVRCHGYIILDAIVHGPEWIFAQASSAFSI